MSRRKYDTLGVMLDVSRNAVMSVASLKEHMRYLQKMGYNCLMLYTEDTYEVEGEPYFGYMRGGYSIEELQELDAYADSLGMELIPCIQTLAHLQGFVSWGKVPVDRDDILLVGAERTYEFVENLLKTVRKCFKTNRIHLGMDEAWALGRGKFMDQNGYVEPAKIMQMHLARVCEIAKKYNFEPMIWSDMFFRAISSGYYMGKTEMPKEMIEGMPKDVALVYWDYYHNNEEAYADMIYNHKQLSDNIWFAGCAWSNHGVLPLNRHSMSTIAPGVAACRKNGVRNLFITTWGDDGGECSRYSLLPSLYYFAQCAKGNTDEEKIKRGFKRAFGAEMEDFLSLDDLNELLTGLSPAASAAPKVLLFNDLFNGVLDCLVDPAKTAIIKETAKKWHDCAKKYRKWHYLFDTAAKLADVLAIKYDLGIRTRASYRSGDKEALRTLAENDYAQLLRAIKAFLRAFEKQWYLENSPIGFDVQEIRIGGLICRVDSCRRRLLDYVNGRVSEIPELKAELLPDTIPNGSARVYGMVATPHRLTDIVR